MLGKCKVASNGNSQVKDNNIVLKYSNVLSYFPPLSPIGDQLPVPDLDLLQAGVSFARLPPDGLPEAQAPRRGAGSLPGHQLRPALLRPRAARYGLPSGTQYN